LSLPSCRAARWLAIAAVPHTPQFEPLSSPTALTPPLLGCCTAVTAAASCGNRIALAALTMAVLLYHSSSRCKLLAANDIALDMH
jgi:hypothetical protein